MNNFISKETLYSTTQSLTKIMPNITCYSEEEKKGTFEIMLFLPKSGELQDEGGLRTRGYFKKSYENKPIISIVTVVFNGEKYLEETIQSVINQTYSNVEYIIIDGGSTDGTLDIIKKYENQIDYWISEKDSGIYDAMNKGIKTASGEIIAFLNADDRYELSAIENVAQLFINDNSIDFIYGDLNIIDSKSNVIAKFYGNISVWKRTMPFGHPTLFVKSSIIKKILFDTRYKVIADYDFILKLMLLKYKYKNSKKIIANFRTEGISENTNLYFEVFPVHKKHFGLFFAIKTLILNYIIMSMKRLLKSILKEKHIASLKKVLGDN